MSSRPAYLPSRNSLREIGFERIVKIVRRSTSRWTRPMPTKIAIATAKTRIAREADVLQDALALDVGERREQHARADQRQREEEQRVEHAMRGSPRARCSSAIAEMRPSAFIAWPPRSTADEEQILERGAARRHRDDLRARGERLAEQLADALVRQQQLDAIADAAQRRPRSATRATRRRRGATPVSTTSVSRSSSSSIACGIALVADLALHDDRDAMTEHLHVREDVRVHEDGLALGVQPHDQVADLLAPDRVEAAHRLVEEHHAADRGPAPARSRCAGACPSSRCAGAHRRRAQSPTQSSSVVDASPRAPRAERRTRARRSAGTRGRSGSRRSTALRAGSRSGGGTRSRARRGRARVARPRVGADQAHQHLQRRGLAGAVRADEAEDLALAHRERDAAQDRASRAAPKPLRYAFISPSTLTTISRSLTASSLRPGQRIASGPAARRARGRRRAC